MPDSNRIDPNDPFHYRVEGVQGDKQEHVPYDQSPPPDKRGSAITAYFLQLVKKLTSILERGSNRSLSPSDTVVREQLIRLKEALITLKHKDCSNDTAFLHRLSEIWHALLEHAPHLPQKTQLALSLHALIKAFQHYPEGEEHTLGYYLSEYAGETWLPQPYLELIRALHRDHLRDPAHSQLTKWVRELEKMTAQPS